MAAHIEEIEEEMVGIEPVVVEAVAGQFRGGQIARGDPHGLLQITGQEGMDIGSRLGQLGVETIRLLLQPLRQQPLALVGAEEPYGRAHPGEQFIGRHRFAEEVVGSGVEAVTRSSTLEREVSRQKKVSSRPGVSLIR